MGKSKTIDRSPAHQTFRRAALPLLVLLLVVAACEADVPADDVESAEGQPAAAPAEPQQGLRPSKQFDFGALTRRVHFAFRAAGDGWEGKHATYEVSADNTGFGVA